MKSRGGSIKFYVCVWIFVWRPGGKGLIKRLFPYLYRYIHIDLYINEVRCLCKSLGTLNSARIFKYTCIAFDVSKISETIIEPLSHTIYNLNTHT